MTTKKNYKSQKNNPTEKKKGTPFPKKSFLPEINLSANQLSIFARITFFLFSFWLLGVYNAGLLYKLQSYSLFLYNPVFAGDTLNQSAGFLIYISRFLTQFLYYPLLGALLLSLGLSGIEWWISRLFKIPSRYFYLSFIPPGLILLAQTSIGYALYYSFEASVVFSMVLGGLFVLLLVGFYRKVKNLRSLRIGDWGVWIALLVFFAFFFLIGVYALVALMMVLIERVVNKEKYAVPLLAGALLTRAFLSFVAGRYVFHETYVVGVVSPLPNPVYGNVFVISFLVQVGFLFYPVIGKLIAGFPTKTQRTQSFLSGLSVFVGNIFRPGISILVFCFLLFAVFYFSFRDSNFRLELRLQHLTEKYEWEEIIKEAEKAQEPTEAIAAYRAIALANTNQLLERFFDFNYQYKNPSTSIRINSDFRILYYYSDLYFHASFTNAAYLWSMEFWVGAGANFYLLKQMALCAMLNGEKELASKYFNLLKQSLFYKKWAEEQEQYNNDPKMLMEHPVYKQIKYYMPKENFVIPIDRSLPVYYMFLRESFYKNAERGILAALYLKDFNQFMRIMQAMDGKNELSACMQEGLIIYAAFSNDFALLEKFRIDKRLKEKVIYCVNEYKKYGNNPDLLKERLKKNYKGTYCYYYFFIKPE